MSKTKADGWTTILSNQQLTPIFILVIFYLATVGGGLHLVSFVDSLYLAFQFRKILNLPPDMNPLEDNLTSRHKRNKSSISTATTLTEAEKRLSMPLESARSSGAPYEDLSRPPSIPFSTPAQVPRTHSRLINQHHHPQETLVWISLVVSIRFLRPILIGHLLLN